MTTAVLTPRQNGKSAGTCAPNSMKSYWAAKKEWDKLDTNAKKKLLHKHGRDHFLASRSYPYLPKEVREDIHPTLLKVTRAASLPTQQNLIGGWMLNHGQVTQNPYRHLQLRPPTRV